MKNVFFIWCAIILTPYYLSSQTQDLFHTKVNYKLTYQESTKDTTKKNSYFSLYLNQSKSVFLSLKRRVRDSIVYYKDPSLSFEKFQTLAPKPKFNYVITKQRNKNELLFVEEFVNFDIGYKEDLSLKWKIENETELIEGYACSKAITSYAGRTYIAWFSPEIALPVGPYKFNGLPGLILKIYDSEQHYVYDFIGLEKLHPPVANIFNINKVDFISKKEFLKKEQRLKTNFLTLFNQAGLSIDLSESQKSAYLIEQKETYSKRNNTIERAN